MTAAGRDRIKEFERENRQLRQAKKMLMKASAYFALLSAIARNRLPGSGIGARPPIPQMIAFITDNTECHGVDRRLEGINNAGHAVCSAVSAALFAFTCRVIDDPEQAMHARRPAEKLIHHSVHGSHYVSIKYTKRLADAGLKPSVNGVSDRYDNAQAEAINGLFRDMRRSW